MNDIEKLKRILVKERCYNFALTLTNELWLLESQAALNRSALLANKLGAAIEETIRAFVGGVEIAVESERERCAKLAESETCRCKEEDLHDGCCGSCGTRIAAAFRKEPSKT